MMDGGALATIVQMLLHYAQLFHWNQPSYTP